jgi:hypothetical protein
MVNLRLVGPRLTLTADDAGVALIKKDRTLWILPWEGIEEIHTWHGGGKFPFRGFVITSGGKPHWVKDNSGVGNFDQLRRAFHPIAAEGYRRGIAVEDIFHWAERLKLEDDSRRFPVGPALEGRWHPGKHPFARIRRMLKWSACLLATGCIMLLVTANLPFLPWVAMGVLLTGGLGALLTVDEFARSMTWLKIEAEGVRFCSLGRPAEAVGWEQVKSLTARPEAGHICILSKEQRGWVGTFGSKVVAELRGRYAVAMLSGRFGPLRGEEEEREL